MINITASGTTITQAIASLRDVSARVLPYATATALTRSAKAGQQAIKDAMLVSFDRPTAYTLNSTFITVATAQSLTARIGIKNQAGANVTPENFLFPEVAGGGRREKRFEIALRLAGFLRPGERAMPGAAAQLDANGNVSAATTRSILRQVSAKKGTRIFAGAIGRKGTRGIWQREGKHLRPLFVFTTHLPQYKPRLDFDAIAQRAATETFAPEFYRAAAALAAKGFRA